MVVARPYISGEKDNVYTELTKQKADVVKQINTLQDKLWQKESKLAEINHQFEEIDEKIKTEFTKKMAIWLVKMNGYGMAGQEICLVIPKKELKLIENNLYIMLKNFYKKIFLG